MNSELFRHLLTIKNLETSTAVKILQMGQTSVKQDALAHPSIRIDGMDLAILLDALDGNLDSLKRVYPFNGLAFTNVKKDGSWLRAGLAANPTTPGEILFNLSGCHSRTIKHRLAKNPALPAELAKRLANLKDKLVLTELATNPNIPGEVANKLSTDEFCLVRANLGKHSRHLEILTKLAKDKSAMIRRSVALNPHLPIHLLQALSSDKDAEVRDGIVNNPSTPMELLQHLQGDSDAHVAKSANLMAARRKFDQLVTCNQWTDPMLDKIYCIQYKACLQSFYDAFLILRELDRHEPIWMLFLRAIHCHSMLVDALEFIDN